MDLSKGTLRVWQRDMDTFLSLWKTESWPPFVEPLLHLLALGYGVGAYVTGIGGQSYIQFIAPGIIASSAMFSASFECMWGTYFRMVVQKTFDAIIATPVSVDDVILGEILYGATRGLLAGLGVLVVVSALGLVAWPAAVLVLPIAFLSGIMFAAMAALYTAWAPSMGAFNYYFTLFMTPMFLFSGIFFPLEQLPPLVQRLSWLSPLSHVVRPFRELAQGGFSLAAAGDVALVTLLAALFSALAVLRMRQRLIR
ncbi:MAG: ABC transporter permease [Chloroflexi bacterium]|nr:ABC transporter permease [Chloroflexota bacterium]